MLEELTLQGAVRPRPVTRLLTLFLKRAARRLLAWEPQGSLLLELPTGQRIRFGMPSAAGEPLLKLHNYRLLFLAIRRGAIGFAEAYIDGDMECSDLTSVISFFLRNRHKFEKSGQGLFKSRYGDRIMHLVRRNSRKGSRKNISEHYDLGNDFYRLWLDRELNYSSAFFADETRSFEQAQADKQDLILGLLDLSGGEKLLEIGCGWGAFACRAAQRHGVEVTGITLSTEQLRHACELAEGRNIADRCSFQLLDYRDTEGLFDHVVSIEMIEAVGEDYWPEYFQVISDRLKKGGCAVLQAITIDERRFQNYRRKADFIQRYIFPGGLLPTASAIAQHAREAGLEPERVESFGLSYALTLREWRRRFEAAWPEIRPLGFDDRFRRQWRYYLSYCEAGFLESVIDVGLYRLRKT